jgi:DNA-binding GntR family transcriptional regulator
MQLSTITTRLHEQLRNDMLIGKFSPLEKINESKLAKDHGVDRSHLRDIL